MKSPSLSPHSIIQPSVPQNMQELASHLVCAACIVHLTPHSIPYATQAIYAHAQTMDCTIRAFHTRVCNPSPLRPRRSPRPSLHPLHAPCTVHAHALTIHTCGVCAIRAMHVGQPAREMSVVEALSKWLAI